MGCIVPTLVVAVVVGIVVVIKRVTVDGQTSTVIGWGERPRRGHHRFQIVAHHSRVRGLQERWLLHRSALLNVVREFHRRHSRRELSGEEEERVKHQLDKVSPQSLPYLLFRFEEVFSLVLPNLVAANEAIVKVDGGCWRCKNVLEPDPWLLPPPFPPLPSIM